MAIPFVRQFPNGRRGLAEIECFPDVEKIAKMFIANGGAYVCEILPSGQARLAAAVERDGKQLDVETETVDNGPGIPAAVDRLIRASLKHVMDVTLQ
jgi:hypothetical protein